MPILTTGIDSILEFAFGPDLGRVAESIGLVPETVGNVFACSLNLLLVLIWGLGLMFVINLMLELCGEENVKSNVNIVRLMNVGFRVSTVCEIYTHPQGGKSLAFIAKPLAQIWQWLPHR